MFFEILLASTHKTKPSAAITLVQKAYKITAIQNINEINIYSFKTDHKI